jgi:hypothetical protein
MDHMQALVDAGRGLAAFGVVLLVYASLFPQRFEPKNLPIDRFTVFVVGGLALAAGFALATVFI